MKRNELWIFMKDKGLSNEHVAKLLNVSTMTVRIWKCNSDRNITTNDFKLLKLLTGENGD